MCSPEFIFRGVNFYWATTGLSCLAQPAVTDLKTLRNRHSSSLGNFGDIVSQGISWDKNALVGHSGGYSLKRLGKKATLDLFYSLCYTVITHSPESHILSLGNSYKKRASCSEHHHKYFVTQTEKTYNKYHEQENWLCYWLQKFWWTTTIQV